MMKTLILFFVLATVISCTSQPGTKISTAPVNVDSLTAEFVASWNNKDSAAIVKAIAQDAVLLNDSLVYKGHFQIADNWISGGVKVVSNLKTSCLSKESDNRIAYSAGTYTHDLSFPGGPVYKINGNYNFAWTKQPDDKWKISFIHIEDLTSKR